MEPRKDESKRAPAPRTEQRKRRFQVEKLEERIAPIKGGIPNNSHSPGWCPRGFC